MKLKVELELKEQNIQWQLKIQQNQMYLYLGQDNITLKMLQIVQNKILKDIQWVLKLINHFSI